jgi:D-glycero-D-manno-heptose 1,7-bisphosphate phosphatase
MARNAGVRSAFVLSGYGRGEWEHQRDEWQQQPDLIAEDLLEAVSRITNIT